MADYRELLRVLENERPGRAVFFEYALDRALAEQLVWRRGDTLWATENAWVQTLADAAAVSGFDCAVVQLSFEDGFPALKGLRLREGMKLAAGLSVPIFDPAPYEALAKEEAVCAVILRNVPYGTPENYRQLAAAVHRQGKPCIWADDSKTPIPLSELGAAGGHPLLLAHPTEAPGHFRLLHRPAAADPRQELRFRLRQSGGKAYPVLKLCCHPERLYPGTRLIHIV